MPRVVNQQVIDDIALIKAAFPIPTEQSAVIEAYLADRARRNETIVEDS